MDADIEALLAGISDEEPVATTAPSRRVSTGVNNTSSDLLNLKSHIAALTAELNQLYAPRAPQMATLALSPQQLTRVIRTLGPNCEPVAPGEPDPLSGGLDSSTVMAVRLCLAEDGGTRLSDAAWSEVQAVSDRVEQLIAERERLVNETAASLSADAPNLTQILDARVASRLIADTGSLRQLSVASPANLVSVRTSPLLDDPLVVQTPAQHKKQAMRIIASKAVLAARMDAAGSGADDTQGRIWRRQIELRMDKLLAPPPSLQHRALPKPVDKKTSRRGGKRIRKMKAKQAPSDLSREQNIIRFGN